MAYIVGVLTPSFNINSLFVYGTTLIDSFLGVLGFWTLPDYYRYSLSKVFVRVFSSAI